MKMNSVDCQVQLTNFCDVQQQQTQKFKHECGICLNICIFKWFQVILTTEGEEDWKNNKQMNKQHEK